MPNCMAGPSQAAYDGSRVGHATGKVQDERCAGLSAVDDAELPSVGTHELAGDGQAEAGALLLGGEERREDRLALGRGHARPMVDDA